MTVSDAHRDVHAVVLGGSLAGLLAARVLSDHFVHVTLVERDRWGDGPEQRRGVPQGRHAHALLARGTRLLEQWFPGIVRELGEAGATVCDLGASARWWHFGGCKVQFESGLVGPFMSRPLLEWTVRRRVMALPNVTALTGTEVRAFAMSADRSRVTGVRLVSGADDPAGPGRWLGADLVVDATGRGSRTPQWLTAFGYAAPETVEVKIDAGYTTRIYRRTAGDLAGAKMVFVLPTPPEERRMGALFPIEGDRWIVTLGGWGGDHAPANDEGFRAFARSLPLPEISAVVERGHVLSDFAIYKFPSNLRRRYERLDRFPGGLLVMGDAICSFNPIYGQGMSVSAGEAEALETCLRERREGSAAPIAPRFFRKAARVVETPWTIAVGEDFRFRETQGAKPRGTDFVNWYTARVHAASHVDPVVCLAFYEAMNLLKPPASLFSPRVALRLVRHGLRRRPRGAEAPRPDDRTAGGRVQGGVMPTTAR